LGRSGVKRFYTGHATRIERRVIELQICAGLAVRARREAAGVSQKQLAERLGTSQARISVLEQAGPGATIDLYVYALIELGADDDEVAAALNPAQSRPVQELRARAQLPYFRRAK
jgi:transcriptional regulator with XRE-family HTH domain